MRKFFGVLVLLVMFISTFANPLEALQTAQKNSITYLNAILDFEQAKSDYEKALIEAKNKSQELSAQLSWLQARQSYRNSMKNFVDEFLNLYIGFVEKKLSLEIQQNRLKIAEDDYNEKQELYKKGIVSAQDLQSSKISYLQQQNSFENAKLSFEQVKRDYERIIGNIESFDPSKIKLNLNIELPSLEILLQNSITLTIADLNVQIAQNNLDTLINPSVYTKTKAERNLQQAKNNLENTRFAVRKTLESQLQNVANLKRSIEASKEQLSIAESKLASTEANYKAGVASQKDLLNAKNEYLSAMVDLLSNIRSFVSSVCSLYIDSEQDISSAFEKLFGR
ncbi:TolC family protein [Pseudothermotoga thermarum]|uniref:Outer membrane efflux protein n=1 Tax=Pseudothermotoga thermarum DSM 5069 TaxID=688269 RepID=F7YXU1_9THEM|nr:TolC family protein [Pseudothermotoga thermarum]AEH50738.1 outer membrane efflux protein [Pseudothermotoga thermarum DSM 5069]